MRLATIVHVSDLHFGDADGDGVPIPAQAARSILAECQVFDGLLGHSSLALYRLAEFWRKVCSEEEHVHLAVTGDLTACGHADQFDMVTTYLGNVLPPGGGPDVGLAVPDWAEWTVPGNHDHWPGQPIVFGAGTQIANRFTLPFVTRVPLNGGLTLRVIGIDTDADVNPYWWCRLRARGKFSTHLATATKFAGAPQSGDISVLLLHHAPSYVAQDGTLEVTAGSRDDLRVFVVQQKITVMLCGHVHEPEISTFVGQHQGQKRNVLEARCGTTTQVDSLPFGWHNLRGRRPGRKLAANTLLVHRLEFSAGVVHWSVVKYWRSPDGFEPVQETAHTPVRVWP